MLLDVNCIILTLPWAGTAIAGGARDQNAQREHNTAREGKGRKGHFGATGETHQVWGELSPHVHHDKLYC